MGLIDGTSFAKKRDGAYATAVAAELAHAARLSQYRENLRFYNGDQWDHGDADSDAFVTLNYIKRFVHAHVQILLGKGFRITVPDDPATPNREDEDRDFVRAFLESTWEKNGLGTICTEIGQSGSIFGDVFLYCSWDGNDPLEDPHPRVDIIPPEYVFPTFGGPYGVDSKRVESVLLIFPKYEDGNPTEVRGLSTLSRREKKKIILRVEEWTATEHRVWADGNSGADPVVTPNTLGVVPLVHIANYPSVGDYWGESDVEDVINLQRELNEKATDVSDVVNYYGSPTTILKGAKADSLERGANRMWSIPADADISNLELSGNMGLSMEYLRMIKDGLHDVGFCPEGVLGGKVAEGDVSGVGLAMKYYPLLERRSGKLTNYRRGLREVNAMFLRLQEKADPTFRKKLGALKGSKYRNDLVFPSPLPRDESMELDKSKKRFDMGITSKRRELEKLEGLSQSAIDKVLKDAAEEREQELEQEARFGAKFLDNEQDPDKRSGNEDPKRPDPEVQGTKVSQKAEDSKTPKT